mgnify:CR=1 FL=1
MPAFAIRGVIEGFYGQPWTHAQRLSLMDFLASHGYNLYVYAPKNDPYHREAWREPYPPSLLDQLRELAARARSVGVAFCFAVSPGLSLRYSDDRELDQLWRKLEPLAGAGVSHFGLFFDDIPPRLTHPEDQARFASLAEAQAHVAHRLLERIRAAVPAPDVRSQLPPTRLLFCPTQYHGEPDTPYLRRLGELLDEEIAVFWTGPEVCSRALTVEHTQAVARIVRRPPLYWDNYPVNDSMMATELHLGPYTGRAPELAEVAQGLVLNPMPQYAASRWILAAASSYLLRPETYEPQAAWERTWRAVAESLGGDREAVAQALLHFAQANLESPLHPEPPEPYTEPITAFLQAPLEAQLARAPELEALFHRVEREQALLRAVLPEETRLEVEPWLDEYGRWAQVGLQALRVMEAVLQAVWAPMAEGSAAGSPAERLGAARRERERLREMLQETLTFRTRVMGDAVRNLAVRIFQVSGLFVP